MIFILFLFFLQTVIFITFYNVLLDILVDLKCVIFIYFKGCAIPWGYKAQAILGFVEELVVNDDPEYQWIDKIRTPRASNEARQTLFNKLSGMYLI